MWPFRSKQLQSPPADSARGPDVIIAGLGPRDSLDLSVETQRLLTRYGKAFTLGPAPSVAALLRSLHIETTELDARFLPGRPYAEVYQEVVTTVIQRLIIERPVVLLVPGNPLLFNTVARSVLIEGRRLGLNVQVLPAPSLVDVLVNEIGIDVSLYGLQVFDVHWLVLRGLPLSPYVPALLLNLEGFLQTTVPASNAPRDFTHLIDHLHRYYEADHLVTLAKLGPRGSGLGVSRLALRDFAQATSLLPAVTSLFLDAVEASAVQPHA